MRQNKRTGGQGVRSMLLAVSLLLLMSGCAERAPAAPPEANRPETRVPADRAGVGTASGAADETGGGDARTPAVRDVPPRGGDKAALPTGTKAPPEKRETVVFETPIPPSTGNRINNLKLAAKKISGKTVASGKEFSFNRCLGARTAKKGYRKATIFVDGRKEEEVGGGICQISTTLYNAALKAGFEIVERHDHSRAVSYAEKGKDAAVAYGHRDLRFINHTDADYQIRAAVEKDRVRVELVPTKS